MQRSVLALLLLVLVSCSDDSTGTTPTLATTTTIADPTVVIEVTVNADGVLVRVASVEIEAGSRVRIPVGTPIRIVTTGEVADEVHVHGYDVMVDVTPGQDETVAFNADIPGIFEVELEDAGTLILELEVS